MPNTTNSSVAKPFDVLEYGIAANQIGGAAQEVNTLIDKADQKVLSKSEAVIGHAKSAGAELVDHMFWRAVEFILIMFAGAIAAMLLYRAVAMRFLK